MAIYEWTRLPACGDLPSPRRSCAAAVIPAGTLPESCSRLVLLGGIGSEDGWQQIHKSWFLARLSTQVSWHRMAPELPDSFARHDASLCWCSTQERLLCFGGARQGSFFNDLHSLVIDFSEHAGEVGRVRCPGGRPSPRSHAAFVSMDSLWLYGGCNLATYPASVYDDLWCFDGRWKEVYVPSGPGARAGHACTKVEDGLIIAGGWTGTNILGDLWTLTGLQDAPVWAQLSAKIPQRACCAIGLLDGTAIVFGGVSDSLAMFTDTEEDMLCSCDVMRIPLRPCRAERATVVGTPPTGRACMISAALGSSLLCAMGGGGCKSSNLNDVFMLVPRMWSPETHMLFPATFRQTVYLWLLLQLRLRLLPKELWLLPIQFLSAHDSPCQRTEVKCFPARVCEFFDIKADVFQPSRPLYCQHVLSY